VDAVGFPALNDILVPDATLFWTVAPNIDRKVIAGRVARSGDLSFTVSTDEHGARRLPIVRDGRRQVVFLGDSTTFGVGVDDERTFPALLQQRLGGVQCLNLGVPGYSAYQGNLRLRAHPFAVPPNAVVVDFGFNDAAAWDNLGDADHEGRMWASRSWVAANSRLLAVIGGLLRRPSTERARGAGDVRPRLTDEEFAATIREIITWCRDRRAAPILLVWPLRAQLQREGLLPKQRVLLEVAAAEHVPVVDLVPVFRSFGGPAAFVDLVHASGAGNAIVADMLEPVLKEALAQ
jgi:lysophospholipase L1-like esterase